VRQMDLLVAVLGLLIAVGSVVLGAWLDLRPGRWRDEPRAKARRGR
jgi:hypothetical protein